MSELSRYQLHWARIAVEEARRRVDAAEDELEWAKSELNKAAIHHQALLSEESGRSDLG